MSEYPMGPEARADYSADPTFREGADNTPRLELLMQPDIADAMDHLVASTALYNHGRLKFNRSDAEQIVAGLEIVEPHLIKRDLERPNGPWVQLQRMGSFIRNELKARDQKAQLLTSRQGRREAEGQASTGAEVVNRFL